MTTFVTVHFPNPGANKQIPISQFTTVGQIKAALQIPSWMYKDTRFFFGNGTELSSVVFTTNTYDQVNFQQHADILNGSQIYITKPTGTVYMLIDEDFGNIYASMDEVAVLRHWGENLIGNTGFDNIDEYRKDVYNLDPPVDYTKPSHQETIRDSIEEAGFHLIEGDLH